MKPFDYNRKWFFLFFILIFLAHAGLSQVRVNGYYRKDGTYVRPHYRSSPDGNPYNNYSYPGNTNPYTGKVATGSQSTYLRNYYKTYPYNRSEFTYNNYTQLLCRTNYLGLRGNSYTISDNSIVIGRVEFHQNRTYKVFDKDLKHIGYVKLNKSGRKYNVYDLYNNRVATNRNLLSINGDDILYGVILTSFLIIAVSAF